MNPKQIGNTISNLRKKSGLTQAALAKALNVSDKTVSKWESGQGYPEITQFPNIARLFGVTVDRLLTGEHSGITFAGNILTDTVKNIDCYPNLGMLANVSEVVRAVGGSVPNTAINLAKIDRSVPISALGKIGDDENGRFLLSEMKKYNIDTSRIAVSHTSQTSFSDVMNLPTGERTFFHYRGANSEFSPADVDISSLNCNIFHIGYILLLDRFDAKDNEYGTVMARFLHDLKEKGIETSIDVVSDSKADYPKMIIPSLKYSDYVIINEIECCTTFALSSRKADGSLDTDNVRRAMEKAVECGVSKKIVVHSKEAGFCLDAVSGKFTAVPSLKIPKELIKGSVGAGDSYCAGCLYSIYNGTSDEEMLKFASSAAACNLFAENSVDGMKSKEEIIKMEEKFGRLKYL